MDSNKYQPSWAGVVHWNRVGRTGILVVAVAAAMGLVGCRGTGGDSHSDAAGLAVDGKGYVRPSQGLAPLTRGVLAFQVGDGFNTYTHNEDAHGDGIILLKEGTLRLCMKSTHDDFYICAFEQPLGNPDQSGFEFSLGRTPEGALRQGTLGAFPATLTSKPDGTGVEIPANTISFSSIVVGESGPLASTAYVRQLKYVPANVLASTRFVDASGRDIKLTGSQAQQSPQEPAAATDTIDLDNLKKQVIAQIAQEHNLRPDDIVQFDAIVEKLPSEGTSPAYKLTGRFSTQSDHPSNVYEAANSVVQNNICAVAPEECKSQKIRHTVQFEAKAVIASKLDGSKVINVDDKVEIDRPVQTTQAVGAAVSNGPRAQLDRAYAYYADNNAEAALAIVRPLAQSGVAEAQHSLGNAYSAGQGVSVDYTQSLAWEQRAAAQGYAPAEYNIGTFYEGGKGVQQNYPIALDWYRKAADQNFAPAQRAIGKFYLFGHVFAKDDRQAAAWMEKAAKNGDDEAQFVLGNLYANGNGVPRDLTQAMAWYEKAAAQGHSGARTNLRELQAEMNSGAGHTETAQGAVAPSFDCARASTSAEATICANSALAALDTKIAREYRALLSKASPEQGIALKSSQREWIRSRAQCEADVRCLNQSMSNRIPELEQMAR